MTAVMQVFDIKHGDTFVARCVYLDAAGLPADYVALGVSIASAVRQSTGELAGTLSVTPGAGVGEFTLRGSTSAWPVGRLRWDIKFTVGSEVFSTQTAVIDVTKGITG